MNIKVFNIRLAKEFCEADQDRMNQFLDSVEVKLTSTHFVTTGTKDFWSATIFYVPKSRKKEKVETTSTVEDLLPNERTIFNALRQWRNNLAQQLNWSSFRICHNAHLVALAKANPQTREELENVNAFWKSRTGQYGDAVLAVLDAL